MSTALPLAFATRQWTPVAASSQGITAYPYLPDATAAMAAMATQSWGRRNEPSMLLFISYEFGAEAAARAAFPIVWGNSMIADNMGETYEPFSIGKLGDEQIALHSSDDVQSWLTRVTVRIDRTVLDLHALGMYGDIDTYVVDFLDQFLESDRSWDAESIVPTLEELPAGWSFTPEIDRIDVLDIVHRSETATPSPANP